MNGLLITVLYFYFLGLRRFLVSKNGKEPRFVSIYESWFRAVPGSEERKRTKIRKYIRILGSGGSWFRRTEKNQDSFRAGFRVLKNGKKTKIRFRVLKNGKKRTNVRSGGLPDSEEQKNQDSFGWASDKRRNQDLFGFMGFQRMENPEDSIGWISEFRKTKKNQDSFSQPLRLGILDNG
ncbi:unnamed protein product [Rhizophagus irregularis]|nr:unnamed protein product [Rhizophagus irregularis]